MRPLQSLPLEARIDLLSARCAGLPDTRRPTRVDSRLPDTLMRGCAMLCFQHASLLECQRQLQQRRGRGTLETRCGVHAVPSDPQRREMVDGVPPASRRQVLPGVFAKVRRAGWATDFTSTVTSGVPHGAFSTMLLDGRDDVHSTTVQGPGCVHRTDTGGEGHFRHTVGSATLVNAGAHRGSPAMWQKCATAMARSNKSAQSRRPNACCPVCVRSPHSGAAFSGALLSMVTTR
jgi:hypothetical protein